MREQATQKLSKAYRLDEIASSVATMQSTSTLEDVASLVLQRSRDDSDAKYVHFFHEKIPSRQLAESTSLGPLDDIISGRPTEGEPLRTRATVLVFKEDYESAARDLTEALRVHRMYRAPHTAPKTHTQESKGHEVQLPRGGRRNEDVILREEDQPSSLEIQILFQRAGVYLAIACQHVGAALLDPSPAGKGQTGDAEAQTEGGETVEADSTPELSAAEQKAAKERREVQKLARKMVKVNAKRALRDYMAFLSHFEYSPDVPIEVVQDFARKVNQTANGIRIPRNYAQLSRADGSDGQATNGDKDADKTYHLYPLSDLLAASPPAGLPPYPKTDLAAPNQQRCPPARETSAETLTYHPLLTDALHSLLLCHCLVQTSAKELLRHAYMVARLARLADGYPVFQASRSPARADWIDVLRRGDNWIQLCAPWETLCAPAPLPVPGPPPFKKTTGRPAPPPQPPSLFSEYPPKQPKALPAPSAIRAESNNNDQQATAHPNGTTPPMAGLDGTPKRSGSDKYDRFRQQAMLDVLDDERDSDDIAFRASMRARQLRAEEDYRLNEAVAALDAKLMTQDLDHDTSAASKPTTPGTPMSSASFDDNTAPTATATPATGVPGPRRWAVDDGKEYPMLSERSGAVARWVREAPPHAGAADGEAGGARRRKKRPVGKGGASTAKTEGVAEGEVVKG